MSRCVPNWDREDVNPTQDVFRLEYEVAELKWENGQVAMHELGSRQRVPSWEKTRAAETLEAIVDQATLQPYYCKTQRPGDNEDDIVPWLNQYHHVPATAAANNVNTSVASMTSDALVPSSNNRTASARDAGCSTRIGSCSGGPSAFGDQRVAHSGGTAAEWSHSASESGTFATLDTYDGDLDGRRLTSRSPENTSSGKDYSKSTSPDDSSYHPRSLRATTVIKEKERVKAKSSISKRTVFKEKERVKAAKSSISNKRRRTPAIHNQSERNRRDKINERMKTLQKLVPNSSKTDKASMLEEIIEYVKQLQAYVHMISGTNMPPMMMPLAMQQQQMQMSMMNSMGMGMGMGMGMNTIGGSNIPTGFHPSTFVHMPLWNGHTNNPTANSIALTTDPMYTFLGCQPQVKPSCMPSNLLF
ncbi:hypothetical protein OSB04_012541 [Centaurea solstitialis]|uniref:BHLH domain-containing protein n=1 Tax=Centaurea solstitialis TaxID=347529 RepID=A0AA38WEP2_9ASTR|nr:hypothetical protein OSB04_012541 [Centaurea solstitialis]